MSDSTPPLEPDPSSSSDQTPSNSDAGSKSDAGQAGVREGLGLDHLNPPEIEQFVRGLPRRLNESLQALAEKAPTDRVTEQLNGIVDKLDELIAGVGSAGYPPDTDLSVNTPDWSEQSNTDGALASVRARLDAAAVEASRRLSGIPNDGWAGRGQLLEVARNSVGALTPLVRSIEQLVADANSRRKSSDDPTTE